MKLNKTLWTIQGLLAALFVFAGVMKLVMPITAMGGSVAGALFPLLVGVALIAVAYGRAYASFA